MQNGHTLTIIRGVDHLDITDLVNYGLVEFDGFGMPMCDGSRSAGRCRTVIPTWDSASIRASCGFR